ncbi:hypothetical protein GWI33_019682 [Rhynchophorus ferrugineus]|uniref:DNA primase large subunit C-terminal domain-containing protein n=1 Tax=Rhynchophorus ferrugineus TaxID=354439 RepID=A0A834HR72_RHYFE|nr:hypothetical protein GWI33_019682 [Rhynchophorus ferrugineus]
MYHEFYSAVYPYSEVPKTLISLTNIRYICERRLKLYSIINKANFNYKPYSVECKHYIINNIWSEGLSNFIVLLNTTVCILPQNWDDCCIEDNVGHIFLALVSSRDHQLSEVFINFEMQWFQIRFEENISDDTIDNYLNFIGVNIEKVSLQALSFKDLLLQFDIANICNVYRTHFSEVPDLFKDRKVLLKDGFLYFSKKYVIDYLKNYFIKSWKKKLKILKFSKIDERIRDIVDEVFHSFKELTYGARDLEYSPLHINNIDSHANNLFPLCMLTLHKNMLRNSHLPHGARTQYAIFLKNAGMCYEDAMTYFQNSFSAKFDEEAFRKKRYFYYFSYCFGKEGRTVHFPESCDNIISRVLSTNDVHGCPFAHYDSNVLKACLEESSIQEISIRDILKAVSNQQYKVACSYYLHDKVGVSKVIAHPNSYYDIAIQHRGAEILDIEDLFVDD